MKLEEIEDRRSYAYTEKCKCGKDFEILTQDGFGEYQTDIYVKCDCGEYVHFELPVN